jgi:hypothetical protein
LKKEEKKRTVVVRQRPKHDHLNSLPLARKLFDISSAQPKPWPSISAFGDELPLCLVAESAHPMPTQRPAANRHFVSARI